MLEALRGRYGLSVRGAARRAGISGGFWCLMEGGRRCPSAVTAGWIAETFELTVDEQRILDAAAVPDHGRSYVHRRTEGVSR
jgi:hypothetical protein